MKHASAAAALALALALAGGAHARPGPTPPSFTVRAGAPAAAREFEGQVEAVRQTVLAAQVAGEVLERSVNAGDRVAAGQVLLRMDARGAAAAVAANAAQVASAQAELDRATRELERRRALLRQGFVSQAAVDEAQAARQAARAQLDAAAALAAAARTQSGYYAVRAPYAGVVAALHVERGDMAQPGRPLLTMYDPAALRVSASVPATALGEPAPAVARVVIPGLAGAAAVPLQVLPTVDPQSMTRVVRAPVPAGLAGAVPGMFARLVLPGAASATAAAPTVAIARSAVLRRGELDAVYVLDAAGRAQLRQVRLGPVLGELVEVLSGLEPGERVLADPAAGRAAPAAH